MSTPIESRIATALSSDTTSAELAALVTDVDSAIAEADATALLVRAKALDPLASPDAGAAHEAMLASEFAAARLRNVLPRLQARHQEVAATEYRAQWDSRYGALEVERDALAAELSEVYPEFARKIPDLLTRIAANDALIDQLHLARPAGVPQHLLGAELVARRLASFTGGVSSISKELVLPAFAPDQQAVWPLPQLSLAVAYASTAAPAYNPRAYSADWAIVRNESQI
jgi:hypothetical protein